MINRADGERALVRGLQEAVADMSFLPDAANGTQAEEPPADLLAAVGNDGNLFVWSLTSVDGTLECGSLAAGSGADRAALDVCRPTPQRFPSSRRLVAQARRPSPWDP